MTTQFENESTFENASLMLEVCRGAYERGGFHDEARKLKGIEATSPSVAYASMLILQTLRTPNGETASATRLAISALRRVVRGTNETLQTLAS